MTGYDTSATSTDDTRDSWWHRNWKWALPLLVLVPVLTCGSTALFVGWQALGLLKQSEPYQLSLATLRAHPEVRTTLGTPIEDGLFATGQINLGQPKSRANLTYRVSGPKSAGTVHVRADTASGSWVITEHTIVVDESGDVIDMLEGGR